MRLIFYDPVTSSAGGQLRKTIEALVPKDDLETYATIGCLSDAIRRPTGEPTLAVLLAANRTDLEELLGIKDRTSSFRIILVVPDRKKETIAAGHLLRPRFLGFADDDFTDVAAVLSKTILLMAEESRWC